MGILVLTTLLAAAEPDDGLAKKMLPSYLKDAEAYFLAVESNPKKQLELKKEPVFEWLNRARGDTQGTLFVWLRDGRPAAIATIFSYPHGKLPGRMVVHELHALDPEKLIVTRPKGSLSEWKPQAGLERKELTNSPAPAATPEARLVQMRRLAQEFTGHELDYDGKRWELRLLPTPLYRYPTAKSGVIDGALFAIMSNGGTDPEVLLLVEAREEKGKTRWEYACGRFSDWELHLNRKDKEVFSSVRSDTNTSDHDPQHLYRVYPEKVVTLEGKVLAKLTGGGGVIPVEEK